MERQRVVVGWECILCTRIIFYLRAKIRDKSISSLVIDMTQKNDDPLPDNIEELVDQAVVDNFERPAADVALDVVREYLEARPRYANGELPEYHSLPLPVRATMRSHLSVRLPPDVLLESAYNVLREGRKH